MSNNLDKLLDVEPSKTKTATIEKAEEVLQGELVPADSNALVPVAANTTTAITVTPEPETRDAKRLEDDFEFARKKMRELIEKGREAADSAILLAQSGDEPRAYEVVGEMIVALVKANKELITLHRTRQETISMPNENNNNKPLLPTEGSQTVNIDKAVVFTGRASDLLREIKKIAQAVETEPDATES